MFSTRFHWTSRIIVLFATYCAALVGSSVWAQSNAPLHGIKVSVKALDADDDAYTEQNIKDGELKLRVSIEGAENCSAIFTLPRWFYLPTFDVRDYELFPELANQDDDVNDCKSPAEARNDIEDAFWPYRSQNALRGDLEILPYRIRGLVDILTEEKGGTPADFENRANELKVLATLLEIAVYETPNFLEQLSSDEFEDSRNDYVAVWRGLWRLMERYADEAAKLELGSSDSARTRVQNVLFKTTRENAGTAPHVSVLELLMKSRAALFGQEVSDDPDSGTRAEAFARILKHAYSNYRKPIADPEPEGGIITLVANAVEKTGYYDYALEDLMDLMDYAATNSAVESFIEKSDPAAYRVLQTKAKLLHKYLKARQTLANETEMLNVIRKINGARVNNASLETLCDENETVKNLYEAALGETIPYGSGSAKILVWDAGVYLRYLFLLSFYDIGGVRILDPADALDPESLVNLDSPEKIQRYAKELVGRFYDEDDNNKPENALVKETKGANTLEDDWARFFGGDEKLGSFAKSRRMGEVLPNRPKDGAFDSDDASELAVFVRLANGIPKNSAVQKVSQLVDSGVNILYYKSFTRLLERYYHPKTGAESAGFNINLYLALVNSLNNDLDAQMNRIFGADATSQTATPATNLTQTTPYYLPKISDLDKTAKFFREVASTAEQVRLVDDVDKVRRRADNLIKTQKTVANTRASIYGVSYAETDDDSRAVPGQTDPTALTGKPSRASISGMTIGDFPILDVEALPNFTLDAYVEFLNDCVEPYLETLKDFEKDGLSLCNADYDVEIAAIEWEAAETTRQVAELGVAIAEKWLEISAVEVRISGLEKELVKLEKEVVDKEGEKVALTLERSMKAYELANRANQALQMEIQILENFINETALPKLEETKTQMDEMCEQVVAQAKKIEDAERKAKKKKRLFGALRAVVNVVGVAAAIFTGGASMAAMTAINSAINIAENIDNFKFDNLSNAMSSLTYIGGEAAKVMSACNVPLPPVVEDAKNFISDGLEKFNEIKKDFSDTIGTLGKEIDFAFKSAGQDLKTFGENFGLNELESKMTNLEQNVKQRLSEVDLSHWERQASGLLKQKEALGKLATMTTDDAINSMMAIRDGAVARAALSMKDAKEQVENAAAQFQRYDLAQIAVPNLQNKLDDLARQGIVLKENFRELSDELRNKIGDVNGFGQEIADETRAKIRAAIKGAAPELFVNLKDEFDSIRDETEKGLKNVQVKLAEQDVRDAFSKADREIAKASPFLNLDFDVKKDVAVNNALDSILNNSAQGNAFADFIFDSLRVGMNVSLEGERVVIATPTFAKRQEDIKQNAALVEQVKSKLKEITGEYASEMERIHKELNAKVEKAGKDPSLLRQLAAEDGAIRQAQKGFQANYDKLMDKLTLMKYEQEEAKAKVEIAGLDVAIAQKDVEINNLEKEIVKVKDQIANLKEKKAKLEYEAQEMAIEEAKAKLKVAESEFEAADIKLEKAKFNKTVFQRRLDALGIAPTVTILDDEKGKVEEDNKISVDRVRKMLEEKNIRGFPVATSCVASILDPTSPGEEVFVAIMPYFAGVLQWMKMLTAVAPDGVVTPLSVGGHDYMWFVREYCRAYDSTDDLKKLGEVQKWANEINGAYKRSGNNDNGNTLFATEHCTPDPEGKTAFKEVRFFEPPPQDQEEQTFEKSPLINVDDAYAVRLANEDKFPVAKIIVLLKRQHSAVYDRSYAGLGERITDSAGGVDFIPYAMTNWIQVTSPVSVFDQSSVKGLQFDVIDPSGSVVVQAKEVRNAVADLVKFISTSNYAFDSRSPVFSLRELEGLWTIYIYDDSPDPRPEWGEGWETKIKNQKWTVFFPTVRVSNINRR